ncbi:hypothetical protein [Planctomicrobium sp. SH527]|uniref:hypothetical protein n=1 Tax=Planctomicrobium sp. SH527 TaxID=3448123 RepID=UPI003F5AF2E0
MKFKHESGDFNRFQTKTANRKQLATSPAVLNSKETSTAITDSTGPKANIGINETNFTHR